MASTTINSGYIGAGITLPGDYTLSNTSTGTITNTAAAAILGSVGGLPDTVVNSGSILGGTGAGITLLSGGTVTNQALATIGGAIGVGITGYAGTVINRGRVTASGSGLRLEAGGSLDNQAGGTIVAGYRGMVAGGGPASATNGGLVSASATGIVLYGSGGTATNQSGGTILAGVDGIYVSAGSATNQGSITATRHGIFMNAGGNVTNLTGGGISGSQNGVVVSGGGQVSNAAGATITGRYIGVDIYGASGTVTNAGTIGATEPGVAEAVRFGVGVTNRLIVDPGAVFNGTVDGGNAIGAGFVSSLELASGATAGILGAVATTGIGTAGSGAKYIRFADISVDAGAVWTFAGTNVIEAGATLTNNGTLTNAGSLDASAGAITDNASLANTGGISNRVLMTSGARLSNALGGTLNGGIYAAVGGTGRTVVNAGLITSTSEATLINMQSDGTVSNVSGGVITGIQGLDISGSASVDNRGLIIATGDTAVSGSAVIMRRDGTVGNAAGATISGQFYGIVFGTGVGSVTNSGSIHGGGVIGVALNSGGGVTNLAGGTITGHYDGITMNGIVGTASNAGYVGAEAGTGIAFTAGGSVTNLTGATVVGAGIGILIQTASGTVANDGSVSGGSLGVALTAGGTVSNTSAGRITSYGGIVVTGGAGTVVNQGTVISSGPRAVTLAAGYANLVAVLPGAGFVGTVDGGNTIGATASSTLELAPAASAGTLAGLGSQFIDFAKIVVDPGASWDLSGANTIGTGVTLALDSASLTAAGTLENNGTIVLDPSTLSVGDLTGSGLVFVGPGGTVSVLGGVATGETIVFASGSGMLALATPGADTGTIAAFVSGDTIELPGIANVTSTDLVNGDTLRIGLSTGGPVDLKMSGDFAGQFFHHTLIGSDTFISEDSVPCYLAGTLIMTDRGEVAVEKLTIGDRAITLSGAARPIKWIGFGRTLVTPRNRCDVSPVIVRRDALADNVPHRDLYVTRRHAILVGDVLVPVEHLINGVSVLWDDSDQVIEYYHIELETHDVVLANGAATESFRDDGSRDLFQNELCRPPRSAPEPPCRPIVNHGEALERAWRAVASRVGQPPADWLTGDPGVHLLVDGRRVEPSFARDEVVRFRIERPRREVRIVSRSCIPAAHGLGLDSRRLGVGVVRVTLSYAAGRRVLPLWTDELAAGFHDPDGDIRWTKGVATLPTELFKGLSERVELELRLAGNLRYPREMAAA